MILSVLFTGYFIGMPGRWGGLAILYVPLGIVSDAAILSLVPTLASLLGPAWLPHRLLRRSLLGLLFGFTFVFFLGDIIVFRLFRRHFDAMIWNVLVTPGSADSVQAGSNNVAIGILLAVAMILLGKFVTHRVGPRIGQWPRRWIPSLLLLVLAERAIFAAADLNEVTQITRVSGFLPYHLPITVKRLARRLGFNTTQRLDLSLSSKGGLMNYPLRPLSRTNDSPLYNIVLIAIEGARADALTAEDMPNLHGHAQRFWWARKHYSAGMATRFGIFGLLYGIPSTYWHQALSERRGPVLIEELKRLDYQFRILSCGDIHFPELRSTAFVDVRESITDQWEGERVDRDRKMTDVFLRELAARSTNTARPFFSFLFYDASHQPYVHPPEDAIHPPGEDSPGINYAKIAVSPLLARALKSRYLNALHYVDRQIGRVVDALERSGEWDRTILVVVGDHGEEFGELGGFGHNTSFNRFQTQTLAVFRLPGTLPRVIDSITSHTDVVPTVLTALGVTNDIRDYSVGVPLQTPLAERRVTLGGWNTAALVGADSITVFEPMRLMHYDGSFRDLPKDDPRRPKPAEILAALNEFRMYFK